MKIMNEFTVDVPVERAWDVLTDLAGIAPCLPGATLTGTDGEDHLGRVKVRLGPVTSEFSGRARFAELDRADHRAVIDARGRETRGGGQAHARVTARLRESGASTRVAVETDLMIAGRLAQFGSGMVQQVSASLLREFAERLETMLGADGESTATHPEPADAAPTPDDPIAGPDEGREPEALDLLAHGRGPLIRLVLPVTVVVVALAVVFLFVVA